eukprot:TRINITY_DN60987_c0_g1_i1.p2 TRINITY_DN60987_c0_g1~~TRINITY_DN60987_c0_g1_i1.p2  ORF type:complete len:121 (-),score=21.33 TRINITY_DN60987_c0_g1_i1:74-436(-)
MCIRDRPRAMHSLPEFEISCSDLCDLAVIVNGSPPPDLAVSVHGSDGSNAGRRLSLQDMVDSEDSPMDSVISLEPSRSPYTARVHSLTHPGAMPEFYIDFQASKHIEVLLIDPPEPDARH